ncbi:hypothetical protein ACIQZO_39500 [Streptomyces sp. NPDC097617]|uniref:hypothetical protein n=1 Tax=Streptomyces sp. NPDC097617 TaxID=3366091 RepID=UPI0038163240
MAAVERHFHQVKAVARACLSPDSQLLITACSQRGTQSLIGLSPPAGQMALSRCDLER